MKDKFIEQLDAMFLIEEEMIEGKGEDDFYCAYNENSAIISVFDGCGGLGSRIYEGYKGHTGAYIGSRLMSGSIHDWYKNAYNTQWENSKELISSLDNYIKRAYSIASPYAQSNLRISGTMVRDLPTTAAIAIAQKNPKGIMLHIIWAGDSRIYLMDTEGLAQLSKDDVEDSDALENLFQDGALTNLLSADGRYSLHYSQLLLTKPTIVFTATDGCFGYISSPMEFEYTILCCLEKSNNLETFKQSLKNSFHEVASDDFTFGFLSFYYKTYNAMRQSFSKRKKLLEEKFIKVLRTEKGEDVLFSLWQDYRVKYERHLR